MILLYCQHGGSRIRYAAGLILDTILGVKWEMTTDAAAFRAFDGGRINYGDQPLTSHEVFVHATGLLSEKGLRPLTPEVSNAYDPPVLFPANHPACHLGYDIFSAAFFLATRYEEYLPHKKDRFGRFEASESLAFRHGFLHRPVIDHYALQLKDLLSERFKTLVFPQRKFHYMPTIDIDVAYAYKGRGLVRTLYGMVKSALHGDFYSWRHRWLVLAGREKDPYDTYDEQLSLHQPRQLKAYYFFLCADYGRLDKNIAVYSPAFHKLVKKISDHAFIGIHPSAASNRHPKKIAEEIGRLTTVLKMPIRHSRQHYLILNFPDTYRHLLSHNITHDFTMGFASKPGFRAGTCTPYFFYDIKYESVTSLKVVPLAIMDGTLKDYMNLQPEQAKTVISEIIREVKHVQGTFVSLWHNDAFSDQGRWKGWKLVYEDMLEMGKT